MNIDTLYDHYFGIKDGQKILKQKSNDMNKDKNKDLQSENIELRKKLKSFEELQQNSNYSEIE